MVYLVSCALAFVFALIADMLRERGNKKLAACFVGLSGIVLFLVQALREGVGADYTDIYVGEYERYLKTGESRFEIGFTLLMKMGSVLSFDYHFILGICSAVIVAGVYIAIFRSGLRCSTGVSLFILSGFFFFSMNGVRQSVAIALLLNAVLSLEDGDKKSFAAITMLAATFHMYSLIVLLVPLLSRAGMTYRSLIILFVAIFGLSPWLGAVIVKMGSLVSKQIATYASNEYLRGIYLSGDFDFSDFLLCSMTIAAAYMVKPIANRQIAARISSPTTLMLCLGVMATAVSPAMAIFSRVAAYCTPFLIIDAGRLIEGDASRNKGGRAVIAAYISMLVVLFVVLYLYRNFSLVFPYVSIFD